jgi:hypothetical protein
LLQQIEPVSFSLLGWDHLAHESLEGDEIMFEQIGNPDGTERKTWKERLREGAIVMAAVAVVLSGLVYVLS